MPRPICDFTYPITLSVSDSDLLDDTVFLDFSVSDSEKIVKNGYFYSGLRKKTLT